MSSVMACFWLVFTVPVSIVALLNAANKLERKEAPFIPKCDYSVVFLFVLLLVILISATTLLLWFCKCCQCTRNKDARRVTCILLLIASVLYALVTVGFLASVFPFVTEAGSSEEGSECIRTSSPAFILAILFLASFVIFTVGGIFMCCCDYDYGRYNNFYRYVRDTMVLYSNAQEDTQSSVDVGNEVPEHVREETTL